MYRNIDCHEIVQPTYVQFFWFISRNENEDTNEQIVKNKQTMERTLWSVTFMNFARVTLANSRNYLYISPDTGMTNDLFNYTKEYEIILAKERRQEESVTRGKVRNTNTQWLSYTNWSCLSSRKEKKAKRKRPFFRSSSCCLVILHLQPITAFFPLINVHESCSFKINRTMELQMLCTVPEIPRSWA